MTAAPEPPPPAGEAAPCPKCGAPRAPVACPRCGLAAANMAAWSAQRSAAEDVPEVLEAAWQRVLEAWTDGARHDEVMRLVTQHDAYAWAAAQYRARPPDEIRDRQLARVRKQTEASMFVSVVANRKDKTPTPYRAHLLVLILFVVAAIAALMFTSIMPKDGDAPQATPAAPGAR
ncbi:MAG: hypothetical protein KF773_30065 [Deltaproteobacteria bacterium]|nr:hypothetical protein [Deltaproteobacteria bacterium]